MRDVTLYLAPFRVAYPYPRFCPLSRFLCLAYAGERIVSTPVPAGIITMLPALVKRVHGCKVAHGDIAPTNVLWDRAAGQLTIIDFEWSMSLDSPAPPGITRELNEREQKYQDIARKNAACDRGNARLIANHFSATQRTSEVECDSSIMGCLYCAREYNVGL